MNFPKAETFPQSVMRERSMGPNPLKLCEELLGYADIPAGSVVLDLGSGAGLTSALMALECDNEYAYHCTIGGMTMEFGEKLQELRKARSLTQEQLAEALYVSRTAVSKWESGRGYPSIDSLREVSRFFSVTIDELISPDEVVSAAQAEKRSFALGYASLVCGLLDVLSALLLVVPVFGNGPEGPAAVSLLALTGTSTWIKVVFTACVGATVICGLCELAASRADGRWGKVPLAAGAALSAASVAAFILARQPYAGITCFALLAAKAVMLWMRDR